MSADEGKRLPEQDWGRQLVDAMYPVIRQAERSGVPRLEVGKMLLVLGTGYVLAGGTPEQAQRMLEQFAAKAGRGQMPEAIPDLWGAAKPRKPSIN